MYVMAAHDERRLRAVCIACVRAAPYEHLLYRLFLHFIYRLYIVGLVRACDQRPQRTQIKLDHFIVLGVFIREQVKIVLFPSLCPQKFSDSLICREDRRSGAHLCAHISDRLSFRNRKAERSGANIFIYLAQTSLNGFSAKHFKDHFFGIDARRKPACQIDLDNTGHGQPHRHTGHRGRDVHSADTDRYHSRRAAAGCMTVAAHQQFAGLSKSRELHSMANPVAGP